MRSTSLFSHLESSVHLLVASVTRPMGLVTAVALMAACGAAPDTETNQQAQAANGDDSATQEKAAKKPTAADPCNLNATIVDVQVSDDCYLKSRATANAVNVVSLLYGENPSEEELANGLTCTVTYVIDVPAGYQFDPSQIIYRGYGRAEKFNRIYSFDGESGDRRLENQVPDGSDVIYPCEPTRSDPNRANCYTIAEPHLGMWTPSCGSSHQVKLKVTTNVQSNAPESMFQLDSVDFATRMDMGTTWRKCGATQPLSFCPAGVDQACNTRNNLQCTSGLVCQERDNPTLNGYCVQMGTQVAPVAAGKECGGHLDIPCQSGLTCKYSSRNAQETKKLGTCAAP